LEINCARCGRDSSAQNFHLNRLANRTTSALAERSSRPDLDLRCFVQFVVPDCLRSVVDDSLLQTQTIQLPDCVLVSLFDMGWIENDPVFILFQQLHLGKQFVHIS
jgi:hypothetical protein